MHRPARRAVQQDLCPRMLGRQRAVTCIKEPRGAEFTEAFTISKPPGSTILKWNKTSMLSTLFCPLSSSRILLFPRIKVAQFLGCIYILLLHAHCFDKELAQMRLSTSRTKNGDIYGRETQIENVTNKTRSSRLMES